MSSEDRAPTHERKQSQNCAVVRGSVIATIRPSLTGEYSSNERKEQGRYPDEKYRRERRINRRPASESFEDIETMTLHHVIYAQVGDGKYNDEEFTHE